MKAVVFTQAGSAGLYHLTPQQADSLPALAAKSHRAFKLADLSSSQSKQQVLTQLGHELAFPDWYGANFDALQDCLCDHNWRPKGGLIVRLVGLDCLGKVDGEALATLIEVLQAACQPEGATKNSPLWFLIDTLVPGIKPLPKA